MKRRQLEFLFLNAGHFFDHLIILIFAAVAALALAREWGMGYAQLIPYATPGFVAFGLFAVPAGWLADKWSREGMMLLFFLGIGIAAVLTALADTPLQIGLGLFVIGMFGAIYHPVGLAMVVQGRTKTGMPLAVNGVFGNLGVGCAALITGFLIDQTGWRSAFVWPGVVCIVLGLAYALFLFAIRQSGNDADRASGAKANSGQTLQVTGTILIKIFAVIFFSTAVGGLIFQSTTFSLPKIFDERLGELAVTATSVGGFAFAVFALASIGQLIVGYLLDRISLKLVFLVVAGIQVVFFTLMVGATGSVALAVSAVFMLAVFGQIPINDVLIGRITRSEWRSRVFGLRYIVTFSVSASSIPLIAWIYGFWGFDALFWVLTAAALAILIVVVFLPAAAARSEIAR
ncbi:MAG TPA: MFS transporter [Gammaproteobacteria bacterium]|nr:MFS transporter [Gammaproteobacteria bacterium]PHS07728.1 MAG: MFS transporter [Acidithiobacillus sp.]RTZ65019.1 MAG: MFS transporter [Gammaproteobacteria bacterium]HAD37698.1 MFS transporter [Gammaproteobacteria bacterium]HBK77506.1 MFS transporter [Gammaproteobacteria bacterium]